MTSHARDSAHLTIGAFSHASRLSQKALRLYDELGLLPMRVDAGSGYRYYAPSQLGSARLIARLRDLDLRLSTAPPERAGLLAQLWKMYEQEHQRRSALAAYLIAQYLTETLHREGRSPMTTLTTPVLTRHVPNQIFISLTLHTHVEQLSQQVEQMTPGCRVFRPMRSSPASARCSFCFTARSTVTVTAH